MSALYGGPLPLPVALEEERQICAMLLNGDVEFWEIQPLTPGHFAVPLHVLIAEIASGDISIANSRDLIRAERRLQEELNEIRAIPFVTPAQLRVSVSAVLHTYRRRELCELLYRLDLELRLGTVTVAGARRRLSEFWHPEKRGEPRQSGSLPPAIGGGAASSASAPSSRNGVAPLQSQGPAQPGAPDSRAPRGISPAPTRRTNDRSGTPSGAPRGNGE